MHLFIAIRLTKRYDARYLEMFFIIIFFKFNLLFLLMKKVSTQVSNFTKLWAACNANVGRASGRQVQIMLSKNSKNN